MNINYQSEVTTQRAHLSYFFKNWVQRLPSILKETAKQNFRKLEKKKKNIQDRESLITLY